MRGHFIIWLGFFALAACDPQERSANNKVGPAGTEGSTGPQGPKGDAGPAGAPAIVNGSRLKTAALVAEDGYANHDYRVRDTLRNEDCTFLLAADDATRCLPLNSYAFISNFFSDKGCTQRILVTLAGLCPAPTTAILGEQTPSCPNVSKYRVFAVGAKRTGDAELFQGDPSNCSSFTPQSRYDYYDVGGEIPPSAFVKAAISSP